jgi:hypothetical protein
MFMELEQKAGIIRDAVSQDDSFGEEAWRLKYRLSAGRALKLLSHETIGKAFAVYVTAASTTTYLISCFRKIEGAKETISFPVKRNNVIISLCFQRM